LELAQKKEGQVIYRQSRGIHVGYSDELRLKPTNEELLKQLAEVSGGQFDPTPAAIFQPTDRTAQRPTPLWPWLVTLAALLLVLDVFLRRVDLSLMFGRRSSAAGLPPAASRSLRSGRKQQRPRQPASA
jgi:hypothetical protein